ncbi:MAG: hypothetical protein ABL995_00965 [Bryobacteraceae bacterium]
MASIRSIRSCSSEPIPMQAHALDNLKYIRETMERAGSFTAVPGLGGVFMGLTALAAAGIATWQTSPKHWLATWLIEGALAIIVGVLAMWKKSAQAGMELWSAPARKFAHAFVPPMIAGAALTLALWSNGLVHLIPGAWLLLYGIGVVTGGAFSVRVIPVMGVCFLVAGVIALFTPFAWANIWLGGCFGGLHIVFGAIIARRFGG